MSPAATIAVDRERFLFLVITLAAQGCGRTAAEPSVAAPVSVANAGGEGTTGNTPSVDVPVQEGSTEDPPESPSAAPAVATADAVQPCTAQNDAGAVDCSWVATLKLHGPACEGVAGTCELLASGSIYRPGAAKVAAACLQRLGGRICDINARKKCYDEGIKASCPEPVFEDRCNAKIQACKAAKRPVNYTVAECVHVLSSLTGGDRDWALSAMGPSAEGTCKRMFTVF